MKILLLSDTHIRNTIPEGRIDNFLETQKSKWTFILQTAKEQNVDFILQAGDFFDKPNPPISLLVEYIRLFKEYGIPIYCVCGQHDLYMRQTDINGTAIGLLHSIGLITLLSTTETLFDDIAVFGISFGGNYSDLENTLKEGRFSDTDTKILVVHDAIGNEPLFPGHKITKADKFLEVWKEFDVILTGDYHYDFIEYDNDRFIVNTGCLLRLQRISRDMERHPHFYIYDTETKKLDKRYIPIRHWRKIFRIAMSKPEMSNKEGLIEFIEKLKKSEKIGISFSENLYLYFEENKTKKEVRELIEECLDVEN